MGRGATFLPVGNTLDNGYDQAGARNYLISAGLAIEPPAMYSQYVGSANTLPVASPVQASAVEASSTGAAGGGAMAAISNPFGTDSPLPWVVVGLFGAVATMHVLHYRGGVWDVNPLGILLLALGALMIVVGFRGNQDNVIAALQGKAWKGSTLK